MSDRNGNQKGKKTPQQKNGNSGTDKQTIQQKAKMLGSIGRLSPQQLTVIAALLANALTIDSITVNKDQTIEIVLVGSVKKKTRLDKLLEEISQYPVGDLIDALMRNLDS